MSKRGVREIKTFANLTDRRRARTSHGAYLELASLALHKHRLLKERQFAESRNVAIAAQLRAMDRKAGVLLTFVEDPRSFAVQPPPSRVDETPQAAVGEHGGAAFREQELRY